MSPKHAPQYKVGRVRTAKTPPRILATPVFVAAVLVLGSTGAKSADAAAAVPNATGPTSAAVAQGWTQDFLNLMTMLMQYLEMDPPPRPDPKLTPADWAAQLNYEYARNGVRPNLSDANRSAAQNAIFEASRLISSHPEAFPEDLAERTKATLQSMSIDLYSKP